MYGYGLHPWSGLVSPLTLLSLVYFQASQHHTHFLKLMLVQCFAVQQSSLSIQSSNPVHNPVQWLDTTNTVTSVMHEWTFQRPETMNARIGNTLWHGWIMIWYGKCLASPKKIFNDFVTSNGSYRWLLRARWITVINLNHIENFSIPWTWVNLVG